MTPHTHSLSSRLIGLGSILVGVAVFALWFTSAGPFSARKPSDPKHPRTLDDPLASPGELLDGPEAEYPNLNADPVPFGGSTARVTPDFDPHEGVRGRSTITRSVWDLLRLLPDDTSLVGLVRIGALRKEGWANDLLSGRRLPRLRWTLDPLGLDPGTATRAVFGIALEARAIPRHPESRDTRLAGKRNRPVMLLLEGDHDRRALLQRFRRFGPLEATVMMDRRIYQRPGGFAMSFPSRSLVAWTYRLPMRPLLQTMLEDASRSALSPRVRQVLPALGIPGPPPAAPLVSRDPGPSPAAPLVPRDPGPPPAAPLVPRDPGPAKPEPRLEPVPPPPPRPGPDMTDPGLGPAPMAPQDPVPGEPRAHPRAAPPEDPDAHLPWVTLLWTSRPHQRIPYPLHRFKGYGAKAALRAASITLGADPGGEGRVRLELRLLYADTNTPKHMAALLRYGRRYVSRLPRVRGAHLTDLVENVPILVEDNRIVVSLVLQPAHIRILLVLFHRLLETGP